MTRRACVIGSGPNGLSAAIVLAQAGLHVDVFEAESTPGGAVRSMELTLPGFLHDFGSAVYPLGAGSPFFASLPLQNFGLEWIHSPAPLAHPLDDGTATVLERNLQDAEHSLGADGRAWRSLVAPFVERWSEFAREVLAPIPTIPKHPLLMARFAKNAFFSAKTVASRFRSERTRALFAGLAAHSFLTLTEPLSGAFGLMMAVPAHAVGWPIPRGGAQSLTNALCQYFASLGGQLHTSRRIASLTEVPHYDLYLCDITPRQLLKIAGDQLSNSYKRKMEVFRYGPGVFKMDYALSKPVPWKALECRKAATVHLCGTFEEIAASEAAMRFGQHSDHPFVLFVQPSLFDPSRAPAGKHTAWAYCHVPNGSNENMQTRIENQIERFAPGFRDCILARNALSSTTLESMDANLMGGDISGGVMDIHQFAFRPTWRHYATSGKNVFICSSSTPPGGGVHGMCGYHAAKKALSTLAT